MARNWHHFSAKEHIAFLIENGFSFLHPKGSHAFYSKKTAHGHFLVQVVFGKEEHRQSRKTMDMSSRHSGIPKSEYKRWINER